MGRREIWNEILAAEVGRWSSLSYDALISALADHKIYVVERDAKEYQVEVETLKTTDSFVLVSLSVDDGSLPASIMPASATFVVERQET